MREFQSPMSIQRQRRIEGLSHMDKATTEDRPFPAAKPVRRQLTTVKFVSQPANGNSVETADEADGDDERYQRTSRPVFI